MCPSFTRHHLGLVGLGFTLEKGNQHMKKQGAEKEEYFTPPSLKKDGEYCYMCIDCLKEYGAGVTALVEYRQAGDFSLCVPFYTLIFEPRN